MNRIARRVLPVLVLVGFTLAPASAATVEEVVAKHIEAKGGADAWAAITSMRATGSYTAFSKVAPFTMLRARDDRFRLDTEMNGRTFVVVNDGKAPWWENGFLGEGARRLEGVDLDALRREFDFGTPLFDIDRLGHTVELVGDGEIEGIPAIELGLTRADGSEERWFLDPETYLEVARLSPGSDFGNPMEQRTFFDDFREVSGVKIPFYVETQWYTRNRVMDIDELEINVEVADATFAMPAPPGMAEILAFAGEWAVSETFRNSPQEPFQERDREGRVEAGIDRTLLREGMTSPSGEPGEWTLSYDRFRETYRYTWITASLGLMGILEGGFDDDGKLTLSDVDTGTTFQMFGMNIHSRVTFSGLDGGGFEIRQEIGTPSSEEGEGPNWMHVGTSTYGPSVGAEGDGD